MDIGFINGDYQPLAEIRISPDDRGFLFADGVYEVARWYEGAYLHLDNHLSRLKRSLNETRISWTKADSFREIAHRLIELNDLHENQALLYMQVTRGAAPRGHAFPSPPVNPTIYSIVRKMKTDRGYITSGINAILKKDIRWSRCDIKSISLLPNILGFQEAREADCQECIFVRDGMITECAHSNIFLVVDGILHTHPESENILSGITRSIVLKLAHDAGLKVMETAVPETRINEASEIFLTNTSLEIAPIVTVNGIKIGSGIPGPVTNLLRGKFDALTATLKA
jgi:D-alanine transaminase